MRWLLLALLPSIAWGFSKDFTLINDRAPLEFKIMFESMKNGLRDPVEQNRLVAYCGRINRGLAPLKKDQAMFLLKAEIYRTILDWKFPDNRFQITDTSIKRVELNLITGQSIYSAFSVWMLEALLADVEKMKSTSTVNNAESEMISRYVKKWLSQADSLSPADFNTLTLQVSWKILERVREKSLLFQEISSEAIQATEEQTFNIPQLNEPGIQPAPKPLGSSPDVGAQAERAKNQAEKSLQNIEVKPSDIPAEDMSNAIDKLDSTIKSSPSGDGSGATSPLE